MGAFFQLGMAALELISNGTKIMADAKPQVTPPAISASAHDSAASAVGFKAPMQHKLDRESY